MSTTAQNSRARRVNTQRISEDQAVRLLRVLLLGGAALAASVAALALVFFRLTH